MRAGRVDLANAIVTYTASSRRRNPRGSADRRRRVAFVYGKHKQRLRIVIPIARSRMKNFGMPGVVLQLLS